MSNSNMTRNILSLWGLLCGLPIVGYVAALVVFDFEVSRGNVIALIAMISFFTFLIVWAARQQKAAFERRDAERQREEAAVAARIAEQERREVQERLEAARLAEVCEAG